MALGLTPEQIVSDDKHILLRINKDWKRVYIEDIAKVQNGYAFSSELFNHNEGLPLIRIRDINRAETENLYSGEYKDEFLVRKSDILIGMDGDFKVSKWPGKLGLLNQRVCRLIFESKYYNKEFFYISLKPYLDAINEETSAVTVKHLSSKTIKQIPLPLPPLPEQRAIIAKIEQLFSELNNGIANLKTAQEQLKVYRQAVLKTAFEGKLTDVKEKEDEVLIAGEPEVRYGKNKLPNGWKEYSFKEILVLRKDKHKPENVENIFYIGLEHIEKETGKLTDNVGVEEIKTIKNKFCKGDVLYGKLRPYLNKAYLANQDGVCSTDILVFKPTDKVLGNLIIHYFLGREFVNDMSENTSGVNLPRVSTKYVESHKISLPNIKEQHQIVQQIDSRLSVCDKVEETITVNLQKSEALRQSILKKAFAGELLTEAEITACKKEKDWEPAGELLKRIKKEKLK